jgi:hypothetical protein
MKKLLIGSVALAISIAASAPVLASVINWTLEGVTFDDGGTASGTFSTDSSTGDIVSYDITTTTGTAVLGAVYDPSNAPFVANNVSGPNSFRLILGTGLQYLNLTFQNPLTSGGIDPIVIGNYLGSDTAQSWECNNCFPIRLVSAGEASSLATPEPSTWAMMLVGFTALAFAGYRFSRREGVAA